jgi:translation initiation factor 5A
VLFFLSIRRTEVQKLKEGNYIMVDNEPCIIKSTERSKSGKHGHAKVRITCIGMFDNTKRSLTEPSGSMVDVPEIMKGNAQISFIEDNLVNIMDLESYQSLDLPWPKDEEMIKKLKELRDNPKELSTYLVEYWNIVNRYFINRVYKSS